MAPPLPRHLSQYSGSPPVSIIPRYSPSASPDCSTFQTGGTHFHGHGHHPGSGHHSLSPGCLWEFSECSPASSLSSPVYPPYSTKVTFLKCPPSHILAPVPGAQLYLLDLQAFSVPLPPPLELEIMQHHFIYVYLRCCDETSSFFPQSHPSLDSSCPSPHPHPHILSKNKTHKRT